MKRRASALQPLVILAVVVGGHLSLFPRVADLDAFYHVGHALAYLEGSLFDTSLPWATRSIIGDVGGDLWWGFHALLLPVAGILGLEWGMRVGGLGLTLILASTVYLVLRRHEVPGAGWWTALFLLAVPNVFFRHLMLRPHVLSLALSIALLSLLVRGRGWHVVAFSAAMSWIHLSLFWAGPFVAGAYAVARIPVTAAVGRDSDDAGVPIRVALPGAVAGAALGWLLRPDALATASLLRVQLLELFALKALDLPVTFAGELSPLGVGELLRMGGLFTPVWLAAIGYLLYRAARALTDGGVELVGGSGAAAGGSGESADEGAVPAGARAPMGGSVRSPGARGTRQRTLTFVAAALLLSVCFLLLALTSARRAMEQWVAFGFLTVPFAWTLLRSARPEVGNRPWLRGALLVAVAAHVAWFGWRHSLNASIVAFPASTLEEAADFLEARSQPGDVVFHARWDNFGPLFARNRTNRYLGGMDPVFLYAHDPASYWEFFFLSADATTKWTCDAFPCAEGTATDTHLALTDHFGARWVVVEPARNPRLSLYLLNDPRFELALDAQHAAVFEVLDRPGPAETPGSDGR